ncbi:MAG: methylglyoxal synthase, partial [Oscillibacter sp.]|nr:methylglyoxal synthase [Oscillibacter sp.]
FNDPNSDTLNNEVNYISRLCDRSNVPFASNIATAEMLVLGLARGDLDYRCVKPSSGPIL